MSETDEFKPEAGGQSSTPYAELFADAQTTGELVERTHKVTFEIGKPANIMTERGMVTGVVTAIKAREVDTGNPDYDPTKPPIQDVTVQYDVPQRYGNQQLETIKESKTVRADALVRMQISDADIARVSPKVDIWEALNPGAPKPPAGPTDSIKLDL